jgi:Tfp pilus assembly protein PilO
MIWRERRVLLLILGLLLAANTIYFFTYRVRYQARLEDREADLTQKEAELEQAHQARLTAERTLQSYNQIEHDVKQVFDEHWSTQTERFTQLVSEVKRLTQASNMVPASVGFSSTNVADADAGKKKKAVIGAHEVAISFGVQGTYEQVRRLINLLELSRQFVIIDRIGLGQHEGQTLLLDLRLKTLFRDEKTAAGNQL